MSTPETAPTPSPTPGPTPMGDAPRLTPRRVHPFNTFFGLVFLAAAGSWFAHDQGLLDGVDVGRLVAVALIALGGLGLVATILVGRRGRRGRVGTVPATPPAETPSSSGSDDA